MERNYILLINRIMSSANVFLKSSHLLQRKKPFHNPRNEMKHSDLDSISLVSPVSISIVVQTVRSSLATCPHAHGHREQRHGWPEKMSVLCADWLVRIVPFLHIYPKVFWVVVVV